jgi:hypothetical protein
MVPMTVAMRVVQLVLLLQKLLMVVGPMVAVTVHGMLRAA